jgi:hypothetical protein
MRPTAKALLAVGRFFMAIAQKAKRFGQLFNCYFVLFLLFLS